MTTEMTLPDLDHWCATEVMGWEITKSATAHDALPGVVWQDSDGSLWYPGGLAHFCPTVDRAQALEVLETRKAWVAWQITRTIDGYFIVTLYRRENSQEHVTASAKNSFSEAICRAVYAAMEGGEPTP